MSIMTMVVTTCTLQLVVLVVVAAAQPALHAAAPAPELSAAEVNSLRAAAEAPSLSSGSAGTSKHMQRSRCSYQTQDLHNTVLLID